MLREISNMLKGRIIINKTNITIPQVKDLIDRLEDSVKINIKTLEINKYETYRYRSSKNKISKERLQEFINQNFLNIQPYLYVEAKHKTFFGFIKGKHYIDLRKGIKRESKLYQPSIFATIDYLTKEKIILL